MSEFQKIKRPINTKFTRQYLTMGHLSAPNHISVTNSSTSLIIGGICNWASGLNTRLLTVVRTPHVANVDSFDFTSDNCPSLLCVLISRRKFTVQKLVLTNELWNYIWPYERRLVNFLIVFVFDYNCNPCHLLFFPYKKIRFTCSPKLTGKKKLPLSYWMRPIFRK